MHYYARDILRNFAPRLRTADDTLLTRRIDGRLEEEEFEQRDSGPNLQVQHLLQLCVPRAAYLEACAVREYGDATVLGVRFDLGETVDVEDI